MKIVSIFLIIVSVHIFAEGAEMKEYVISESSRYTSLDPLDADLHQNLSVARMVYATPLEIDATDTITSLVLDSFNYNKTTKTITWQVRPGLQFSDGKPLTVDDVVFSVTRMLHANPKFPVIETIEGTQDWLQKPTPLKSHPSGITVDGNKITIRLSRDNAHALFRFCLELFSIIPKSCVDLQSGKINCAKIPESGRYSIVESLSDQVIFKRRLNVNVPENIMFKYIPAINLKNKLESIPSDAIVAGIEAKFPADQLKYFSANGSLYYLPASRFSFLLLQPTLEPFTDKRCRQIFTDQFRHEYLSVAGEYSPAESSIFTKLLPGYVSRNDLEKGQFSDLKNADFESCKRRMHGHEIKWGYVETEKNSAFTSAINATLKKLELKSTVQSFASLDSLSQSFVNGHISFFGAGSGFWANDPVGDLQMLFTPNLHKILSFVSKDENLQKLISNLVQDQNDISKFTAVNKYLHDEALFNVYTHVRRFFYSKDKAVLKQIPQGTSSPTPWQVFQ